jgi:hypothetical protein
MIMSGFPRVKKSNTYVTGSAFFINNPFHIMKNVHQSVAVYCWLVLEQKPILFGCPWNAVE